MLKVAGSNPVFLVIKIKNFMPQFDFFSFSGQVFWTLSSFCLFYFIVLRFYLTRLSETLKMRQKLLSFSTKENKVKDVVVNIYDSFLSIMLKKN